MSKNHNFTQLRNHFSLRNAKLQTKILIAFSFVIILSVLCFSVFSQSLLFERFESEATKSTQQLCIKISENVDTYIDKIDEITKRLLSDPDLMAVLDEVNKNHWPLDTYDNLSYNRRLGEVVSNAIALTSYPYLNVNIYNNDCHYQYVYNQGESSLPSIMQDSELADRLPQRKMVIYSGDLQPEDRKNADISFVRSIFDFRTNQYGYVEIQDDTSKLAEICNIDESGEVILTDDSGRIIFTTGGLYYESISLMSQEYKEKNNGFFINDEEDIFFFSKSKSTGGNVFIKYSHEGIYSSLILIKNATFAMVLAVSLLCLSLVFFFAKKLVRPIQNLRDSIMGVSFENMGIAFDDSTNNEIVMLGDAFQQILDELKIAAEREIALNKAESDARFAALQAQIAPHFIHNVLYAISIAAREERFKDVAVMCKQLSDMLRYTVSSNKLPVRLEEEINCVVSYLSLEAKNYEDSLFFDIDIDCISKNLPIPRLSIQPIVENSIKHAFQKCKPPYRIYVKAEVFDGNWMISIRDNGTGISDDSLHEIQRRIRENELPSARTNSTGHYEDSMGGMGIANSILRMKMLYKDSFDFSIYGKQGSGTTVILMGTIHDE